MAEYTITEIDLPNGDKCRIHANATTTADGLMSKEDKAVLDALASVGSPINFDATGETVTITSEDGG